MIDIMSLLRPKKSRKKTAGQIAKERLKLVLIHDRSDCSAELLENIRKDIMVVLSKYMEIDMEALDIQISTTRLDENDDQEVPALYANIPIKNLKHVPSEDKKEDKKDDDKKLEDKDKDSKDKESKDSKNEKEDKDKTLDKEEKKEAEDKDIKADDAKEEKTEEKSDKKDSKKK